MKSPAIVTTTDVISPDLRWALARARGPSGRVSRAAQSSAPDVPAAELPRLAMEALDQGIVVVRPSGEILYANPAARDLLALDTPGGSRAPVLAAELVRAVAPRGGAAADRFTRAIERAAPGGGTMFVRTKQLLPMPELLLLSVSRRRLRKEDLAEHLARRFSLSHREIEVLLLVRDGLRNRDIAIRLGVKVTTVKWYVARILSALGVRTRSEAAAQLARIQRALERQEEG